MVWLSEVMVFSLSFFFLIFWMSRMLKIIFYHLHIGFFFWKIFFNLPKLQVNWKSILPLLFCWELIFSKQYNLFFCSSYQMKTTNLICNLFSLSGFLMETPFYYTQESHLAQWDAQLSSAIDLYIHRITNSVTLMWNKTDFLFCLIIIWMMYFQSHVQVLVLPVRQPFQTKNILYWPYFHYVVRTLSYWFSLNSMDFSLC